MPIIKTIRGKTPSLGKDNFIADNATIVGDVITGKDCSFWFNAVVRGDVNAIRLGEKVNVQDNAVIHCTYERTTADVGDNVSIGHNAIVHGCTVRNNVLIGMGAIVMDKAIIGEGSIVAAGAVVLEGTEVPPGSVMAGVPAKRVKDIDPEKFEGEVQRIANNYTHYASWFRE